MTNIVFGWLGLLIQQCLGGDDESRSANAALKRGIFQKFLLQRMKSRGTGHAFNRGDRLALGLHAEDEAGVH